MKSREAHWISGLCLPSEQLLVSALYLEILHVNLSARYTVLIMQVSRRKVSTHVGIIPVGLKVAGFSEGLDTPRHVWHHVVAVAAQREPLVEV